MLRTVALVSFVPFFRIQLSNSTLRSNKMGAAVLLKKDFHAARKANYQNKLYFTLMKFNKYHIFLYITAHFRPFSDANLPYVARPFEIFFHTK